jgi:hypothetical protein
MKSSLWRLLQKCVVCTTLDIYVSILGSGVQQFNKYSQHEQLLAHGNPDPVWGQAHICSGVKPFHHVLDFNKSSC